MLSGHIHFACATTDRCCMREAMDAVRELEAKRDRYREALEEIRDADPVDMALDPGWAARIAKAALNA